MLIREEILNGIEATKSDGDLCECEAAMEMVEIIKSKDNFCVLIEILEACLYEQRGNFCSGCGPYGRGHR